MKILVVTIPKSGTYFTGLLLRESGFTDLGLHYSYFGRTVCNYHKQKKYPHDLTDIEDNSFVLSHMRYPFRTHLTTVFVYRNLRDCIISHARFRFTNLKDYIKRYSVHYKRVNNQTQWLKADYTISYEDMLEGKKLPFITVDPKDYLGTKTLTRNDKPTKWQDYWDDEWEAYFQNFIEANKRLGYE